MKVSEAVARALAAEGAKVVFSLLGDTNMEMVVRLAELGMPVHESRHEGTAMAMADGFARTSGEVAICAVTAGPALAHTFVPLLSAARQPSPVVVLTGPHSRDDLEHRQALDHEGLIRLTGASYQPVASPGVAVERVRSVVDLARSQGKPVVLDVPADVQDMEYPWDLDERPPSPWLEPRRISADPASIARAADIIAAAQRPVILAGAGASSPEARQELVALAAERGALLATTINARGLFHGDHYNAGVAGLFAWTASAELFAEADCVVSFGASMNSKTTENGYLFAAARFVQVDVKPPAPMDSGQAADCYVQSDAITAARDLRASLGSSPAAEGFRTETVAKSLQAEIDPQSFDVDPGELDPRALCTELDAMLPAECSVVSGAAHYWSFPIMHMPRWRRPLYSSYAGSIGYSVSVALGVFLATRQPVLAFEGDGGFMMYPHALETAARTGARLLVVVMNDRALGAEYHKLRAKGLDNSLAESADPDLAGMARQMGCPAVTLTDLDQLPGVVGGFLAGDGPLLVDARISRNVVSLPYRRAYFGLD